MYISFGPPAQGQPSASSDYAAEYRILALLLVADGMTTVRNMWGHQTIQNFSRDIDGHGDRPAHLLRRANF